MTDGAGGAGGTGGANGGVGGDSKGGAGSTSGAGAGNAASGNEGAAGVGAAESFDAAMDTAARASRTDVSGPMSTRATTEDGEPVGGPISTTDSFNSYRGYGPDQADGGKVGAAAERADAEDSAEEENSGSSAITAIGRTLEGVAQKIGRVAPLGLPTPSQRLMQGVPHLNATRPLIDMNTSPSLDMMNRAYEQGPVGGGFKPGQNPDDLVNPERGIVY